MKPTFTLPVWVSLVLFLFLCSGSMLTDEQARYNQIREALNRFTTQYPQQKVYLQLDRTAYAAGEVLWFKAYLVNAMNHYPDTLSTNLYVELIGRPNTRLATKRFRLNRGFSIGDFTLSDTLPEGLYQIRAYTRWMENFPPEFFFSRNFRVINPDYSKRISPKQARENRKEINARGKLSDRVDLQFMPEGGDLVKGLTSTVGFKAVNMLGKGIAVTGKIVDDKGREITSFSSWYRGIGSFRFTPEPGRKYTANAKSGNTEWRVPLPDILPEGVVMHVEQQGTDIRVGLHSTTLHTNDPAARDVLLVGQVGGRIYAHIRVTLNGDSASAILHQRDFPSGIMQLTAFSGRGDPLAERLVFINRDDLMKIRLHAADTLAGDRQRIILSVKVTDQRNIPLAANLSMAVTRDKHEEIPENRDNIVSHMLLTSDLKGYVEDPYDYLADHSAFMQKALDNLMLTQGWRRFDWKSLMAGKYPVIRFAEEKGITVYGRITTDVFDIPLKKAKVQMSILSSFNDVFTKTTDDKGFFWFDNLSYADTVSVRLEAWKRNGKRNLLIDLPDEEPDRVTDFLGDYSLITQSQRNQKAYRQTRYEEAKQELAQQQQQEKDNRDNLDRGIYGEPDYVLKGSDLPTGSKDLMSAIQGRVAGVNVSGGQMIIRGPSSIIGNTDPLFLVDGAPVHDVGTFNSIPVEDVDRIEFLKGPSAAIYGMRGANGVVAVYTKHGHFMKRGVIDFDMLGYSTPRKFYQPKYQPQDEPNHNYTVCWQPVITTNADGFARVMLDKPGVNGTYHFVVEGLSYKGHVGMLDEVLNSE